MNRTTGTFAQRGFTLIELLVVLAILSLLVVTFLPAIWESQQDANAKETHGRMMSLGQGIDAFGSQRGWYPPDDLTHPDPEIKFAVSRDNGINTGIESLVVFLGQVRGSVALSEHASWLANTDKDDNGVLVPELGTSERQEVVDLWGTPLAYFASGSFDKLQTIRLPGDGGDVPARAWKGPGQHRYQLISAGQDKTFDTGDDIVLPERKQTP